MYKRENTDSERKLVLSKKLPNKKVIKFEMYLFKFYHQEVPTKPSILKI